jgi:hypothetical protein
MADSIHSPEPYKSPEFSQQPDAQLATTATRRPGGLTAICVIAVILGVLGLIFTCFGMVTLMAGPAMQSAMTPSFPGESQEVRELNEEMNEKTQALWRQYFVPNMAFYLVNLAVAICLVVGGVKGLKVKPEGRPLLIGTFCGALIFELLRTPYLLYVQMQAVAIQQEYLPKIMEASAQGAPVAINADAFVTLMKVVGYAMIVIFMLVKGAFYAVGAGYMTRPGIKSLFEQGRRS